MKKLFLAVSFMGVLSIAMAQNAIPNPGFENWNVNPSYDDAVGWGSINALTAGIGIKPITKATAPADIHSGSFAIKLESKSVFIQTAPGIAATGTINSNGYIDGGVVYTRRPISMSGWYKYTPNGTDTASVEATLSKWNTGTHTRDEVGQAVFKQYQPVGAYTQFSVNFTYTSANFPDTLVMILLTSSQGDASPVGSKLWIDDLAFELCTGFSASATSTNSTCTASDGSVTAAINAGTGTLNYNWSGGGATATIAKPAGTYTVTVTDQNACTVTASTTVIANTTLLNVTATPTQSSCTINTGSVLASTTGGTQPYSFLWSTTGTLDSITNVGAGSYTVTVSDINGCVGTATGTVTTPNGPSATTVTSDVACFGNSTGAVILSTTGGTAPITYTWSPNVSTNDSALNLTAGSYSVTINDANNCSFLVTANVTEPAVLTIFYSVTNVSCFGEANGSIDIVTSGGTAPYSINWSGSGGTNLAAGNYSVTITDANGCPVSVSATITEPASLGVTSTVTDATSQTATDGSIIVTSSGGTNPYAVNWSSGNGTNLSAGSYCFTVTDANNCTTSACDTVSAPTGISSLSDEAIKLYPNPASNRIIIETYSANEKFNFCVFNLEGRLINEMKISGEKVTVDVKHLPTGLYTYQLKNVSTDKVNYGKLKIER